MTKRMICLIAALALLLLCGCAGGGAGNIRTKRVDGVTYTIDTEAQTISDGRFTYRYTIQGNRITITYPNGATWWMSYSGNSGAVNVFYGGHSDNYDESVSAYGYAEGDTLKNLVFSPPKSAEERESPIIAILMIIIGLFNLASPRTAWYLSCGWRFKDAEPSEAALVLGRLGGGVLMLVGAIILFAA